MSAIVAFIVGAFLGGTVGAVIMATVAAARRADAETEQLRRDEEWRP